jgi:L-asparaginase II
MEPISVAVRRGPVTESVHTVHAVAVEDGEIAAHRGDSKLLAFYRSACKPIQALPLARERDDLDEAELAIACASHQGEPAQVEAVRSLLAKAPATVDDLECGFDEGRPHERIYHNCSGKHAGMLALCRARGWPTEGYRLAGHPCQDAMLAEIAAVAEKPPETIPTAVDGCGVLTFALTLERMAFSFSRLAAERPLAAMRARPELIGGEGAYDTQLMLELPGWAAKRGAEGLICAGSPDGLGVALKVEDGNPRALKPALAAFLGGLGFGLDGFASPALQNSRGENVGVLEVVA